MKKGYKHTPEALAKMRGRKLSPGHIEKIKQIQSNRSIEWRKKLGDNLRGDKSKFWKGGVTSTEHLMKKSMQYRLWRKSVMERDSYTCIWCGKTNQKGDRNGLHADHIKPWSLFPELRFAIDNGRTLCIECHKKTDTYGVNVNKIK